ncbi:MULTISPECIES: sterol desaturase family protein [Bacillaceae]|uniref:sterol desaturase family protein n=1 Tax=Bacillaceae TaxID=186817 RepID=UPI000BED4898|nr:MULTISPECIES: sterol desaturase family protein [unclassified Bacillus (in: firmicutes)]PEC51159.1 fatty acid hydroxylase [Bacillus sp. AFS096315]PFM77530.1 fatty acid hydroxylase [Bacillus sp. AFS077874]
MKGLYRDFFLHFDIIVMGVLFLVGIIYSVGLHLSWLTVLIFIIGLIFFMFSEYVTHRFIFHLKAPKNKLLLKFMKRIHYDHHTYPDDLKLLFLPIWYSIPNLGSLCIIYFLISKDLIQAIAFGSGLVFMLLVYEWKHYVAHRPIKPLTKVGRQIKKLHILHHFKNENFWYGVSTPIFDGIFGTLKDEKEVVTSNTAKALEERM